MVYNILVGKHAVCLKQNWLINHFGQIKLSTREEEFVCQTTLAA